MFPERSGIGTTLKPEERQNAQNGPQSHESTKDGQNPTRMEQRLSAAFQGLSAQGIARVADLAGKATHGPLCGVSGCFNAMSPGFNRHGLGSL